MVATARWGAPFGVLSRKQLQLQLRIKYPFIILASIFCVTSTIIQMSSNFVRDVNNVDFKPSTETGYSTEVRVLQERPSAVPSSYPSVAQNNWQSTKPSLAPSEGAEVNANEPEKQEPVKVPSAAPSSFPIAAQKTWQSDASSKVSDGAVEHVNDPEKQEPVASTLFDYNLPPNATTETLDDPLAQSTARLIVLVLSARENAARRSMIRQTWGRDHAVYFVIGGPNENTLQEDAFTHENTTMHDGTTMQLLKEQVANRDLIDTVHPDSYRSLPHKLKYALRWVVQNCEATEWIVKVDDDMFMLVKSLGDFLSAQFNPSTPTVVGRILRKRPVHRSGKWSDPEYSHRTYPLWPQGSCGYAISRPVANFIALQYDLDLAQSETAKPELYIYQGEDTSLGIWLEKSGLDLYWVHSPFFDNHGDCMKARMGMAGGVAFSLGHDITPEQMHHCYAAISEQEASSSSSEKERLFYLTSHAQHFFDRRRPVEDNLESFNTP